MTAVERQAARERFAKATSFRLKWDGSRYTVSIPNYDGGMVFKEDDVWPSLRTDLLAALDALDAADLMVEQLKAALKVARNAIPWNPALTDRIDAALKGKE